MTDELRAVVAKMTPGGFEVFVDLEGVVGVVCNGSFITCQFPPDWGALEGTTKDNAAGIVYLKNNALTLADEIDRLRVENEQFAPWLKAAGKFAETELAERDRLRAELAAANDERARLREALAAISDLPGEINPSNYSHDDACELNRQFCYGAAIARAALTETNSAG